MSQSVANQKRQLANERACRVAVAFLICNRNANQKESYEKWTSFNFLLNILTRKKFQELLVKMKYKLKGKTYLFNIRT